MTAQPRTQHDPFLSRLAAWVRSAGVVLNVALVGGALAATAALLVPQLRAAARPEPPKLPATMEEIDWHAPESSIYCVACHRQVAPAMAGLDVRRGHSQNVPLNEVQMHALADMGTVAGPNNTLICMSCHHLDPNAGPYMLAETLEGSRLCQRCHPGHYAQGTPHDLRQSAPDEANRLGQTVATNGPCSACHLAHSYAREIVPSPLDPDGWCLTCHREYGVAAGHARTQRMHPPESHCMQCHNPHDRTHDEFLRDAGDALCLRCHAQYARGTDHGMHPLVPLRGPLPPEMAAAGAVLEEGSRITCRTCHTMHRAGGDDLLVLPLESNALCQSCHADKLTLQGEGVLPKHGRMPVLNAEQQAVVAAWKNPTGPHGELLCASCHRVHDAEPQASLLAFKPHYGETCVACHPAEASVFGSAHDLRTKFPNSENKAGLTPLAHGACSACHMAHQYPRERVPGTGDPAGQCMSCHLAGRIAQAKLSGTVEHPDTRCTDCHDPHARANRRFLEKPEVELCLGCHQDTQRLLGGPHDLTQAKNLDQWNAVARDKGGVCLPCHVPHGGDRPDLFRVAQGAAVGNHDEVCLACHADAGWDSPTSIAAIHPQQITPEHSRVNLALVPTDEAGNKRLGCRTCHDPHGGAAPVHLARVQPGEPTEKLCLQCHVEKELIKQTGHAAERLAQDGFDADSCKPCHAMHAKSDGTWGAMLSPRFLLERCDPMPGQNASCVPCLACHREGGPAPIRVVTDHPEVIMMNIVEPNDPGYLPLFSPEGREHPQGQIVCRTCHVSHGRLDLLKLMAENPNLTPEQHHAIRAQVRSFNPPNACTACHGPEARNLFLRFHDAQWREQNQPKVGK